LRFILALEQPASGSSVAVDPTVADIHSQFDRQSILEEANCGNPHECVDFD
jgi:hypothetical protein